MAIPGVRGNRLAHRVYYENAYGRILTGMVVDHLCCVPMCVRPDHMQAVTQAENVKRGAKREAEDWRDLCDALTMALGRLEALGEDCGEMRRGLAFITLRHYGARKTRWKNLPKAWRVRPDIAQPFG